MEDILIDTRTLMDKLMLCKKTAVKVGKEAGARVQIGSIVRWNVKKLNIYLDKQAADKGI